MLETGETVRLVGVDTPESVHPSKGVEPYGKEAAEFTREQVQGDRVRVEFAPGTDKYGRRLGYVWYDGRRCLNVQLLRKGLAQVYVEFPFSRMAAYVEYEREAREKRVGIWRQ